MATAMIVAASVFCVSTVVGALASIVSIHTTMRIKRTAIGLAEAAFVITFAATVVIMGLVAVSP